LTQLDTAIVFVYRGSMIAMGLYAGNRQKTVGDDFLARRGVRARCPPRGRALLRRGSNLGGYNFP
jgi:hypothetical protein